MVFLFVAGSRGLEQPGGVIRYGSVSLSGTIVSNVSVDGSVGLIRLGIPRKMPFIGCNVRPGETFVSAAKIPVGERIQ